MVPGNTILHPIAFASKSLMDGEHRYSNIERELLGLLHRLKKFHHYCFVREVYVITDHKPLVSIFKKDMVTLSQSIQQILLKIHQYRVQLLFKPGPQTLCCRLTVQSLSQGKQWHRIGIYSG